MSLVFWKQIEIKHQICYCNNIIRVSRAKVEDCDDTWDGPISHFWASCSIGLEVCPVTALCCHLHHNLNWLQIKGQCILEEGLPLTYATLATNQRIKEVFKSLNVIYETSVGADHSLLQILSSVSILHLSCGTQYVNIVNGYYDPRTSMATPGIPHNTGQSCKHSHTHYTRTLLTYLLQNWSGGYSIVL